MRETKTISLISKGEKSEVSLVTMGEGADFAILKKYNIEISDEVMEELMSLEAECFPKIYEFEKNEGYTLLLEQYIPGMTLEEILESNEAGEEELLQYYMLLCEAVRKLHENEKKIIHRDIKPSNILIDKEGKLYLIDFDAARVHVEGRDHDTVLLGTKEYASPEQYGFAQTDERSDIYSMGIILNEILAQKQVSEKFRQTAKRITDKATMFSPDMRYDSVVSLEEDLRKCKTNRNRNLLWIALAACVPCLVGALLLLWPKGEEQVVEDMPTVTETVEKAETAELPKTPAQTFEPIESSEEEASEEAIETGYEYRSVEEGYRQILTFCYDIPNLYNGGLYGSQEENGFYAPGQETVMGWDYPALRYYRSKPRDMKVVDLRFLGMRPDRITITRFDETKMAFGEEELLPNETVYVENEGVVVIPIEYLQTLEPGNYKMFLGLYGGGSGFASIFYLVVHDEEEQVEHFAPRALDTFNYYDSQVNNDVYYYINCSTEPIEHVQLTDAELVDPENYYLLDNGYGLAFKGDYLATLDDQPSVSFDVWMQSGKRSMIKVINIQYLLEHKDEMI